MQVGRLACVLAFSALIASCRHDADPEPTLELPDASKHSAARDAAGRLVVAVTRDARILHAGKPVTLDELAGILEGAGDETRVVLHADADARWCHVQWVLTVVAEHCFPPAEFAVEYGGKDRTLSARNHKGDWRGLIEDLSVFDFNHVAVGIDAATGNGAAVYRMGRRETTSLRQLRLWLREVTELLRGPCKFGIEASAMVHARHPLVVLNEFLELGIEPVTWGLEAPHPWVREQRRLPEPRQDHLPALWFVTDLVRLDVAPMSLPVAFMAQTDKADDPDDRVIINLDRKGRLLQKGKAVSLDELEALLREEQRRYHRKRVARGASGYEQAAPDGPAFSKLYVLLRADKDTPWREVKWLLALLDDQRIYKVQFAVTKTVDLSYGEQEAKELSAKRHEILPDPGLTLAAKLQCFLRTSDVIPEEVFIDVILQRDARGDVTFRLDGRETRDLDALRDWIAKCHGEPENARKTTGRVTAPDEIQFKYVVAVVNSFAGAGYEKIDFVGVAPAPPEIRRRPRFPR